jgi:hypothetical protein
MRKKTKGTQPVENDGDDLLPVPKKGVVPADAAPAKPKRKRTARRALPAESDDATGDQIDSGEGGEEPRLEMDGLPQHSRESLELEAQMKARMTGEPIFPYPPELREVLRPHWLELVNSFPKDHFQPSDIALMKIYVQCAYDIERQNLLIEEEGEVVIGGRGNAIVNPRCKVRESRIANLMGIATKFRNQPASRTNSENFSTRQGKAQQAAQGAQTAADDDDGLLATSNGLGMH